jgi:hypothetical protein
MSFLKKNLLQEQKDDAKIGKQIMAQMKRGFKKNETGGHFYQKGEGANVYYDIFFSNNTSAPINAIFQDQRSNPVVQRSSDYELVVTKFTIPVQLIPIFIPNIVDENKLTTSYTVTLTWGANPPVQIPIVYKPLNLDESDTESAVYIYSYQHFIDLINIAYASAFAIVSAYAGFPAGATDPPFLTFDSGSGLITMNAQTAYQNASANVYSGGTYTPEADGEIGIYMNNELFDFFESWKAFAREDDTAGRDQQILIMDNKNNAITTPVVGFAMIQEFSTLYLWNDFHAIVIQSTLPTRNEWIQGALPTDYSESASITTGEGASADYSPILATFDVQTMISAERGVLQFVVGSEFKRIDLLSDNALQDIQISVFWQSKNYGQLFQLQIPQNKVMSMQLLFIKKKC